MLIARPPRTPSLVPFVASIWLFRGGEGNGLERLLPNGRMQLLVNVFEDDVSKSAPDGSVRAKPTGPSIQGPRLRPSIISTSDQRAICGVSFEVGGAYPFFLAPPTELTDQTIDLAALWGRDGNRLRERMLDAPSDDVRLDVLESTLVERMCRAVAKDGFDLAIGMLTNRASVREVGERLGLSPARLIELFRHRTGLTPKCFARIERFQRLIHAVDGAATSWAQLALAHGYSDQAHMIRDFRWFSGTIPTAYRAASHEARNHVPLPPQQKNVQDAPAR